MIFIIYKNSSTINIQYNYSANGETDEPLFKTTREYISSILINANHKTMVISHEKQHNIQWVKFIKLAYKY